MMKHLIQNLPEMSNPNNDETRRKELVGSYVLCFTTSFVGAAALGLIGAYSALACVAFFSAVALAGFHAFWAIPFMAQLRTAGETPVMFYRVTLAAASLASGLCGPGAWLWLSR